MTIKCPPFPAESTPITIKCPTETGVQTPCGSPIQDTPSILKSPIQALQYANIFRSAKSCTNLTRMDTWSPLGSTQDIGVPDGVDQANPTVHVQFGCKPTSNVATEGCSAPLNPALIWRRCRKIHRR